MTTKGRSPGGSTKTPVIGAVERGGKVVAKIASDLTGPGVLKFLRWNVDATDSTLITDEYRTYRAVRSVFAHETISHSERFVDGDTHNEHHQGILELAKARLVRPASPETLHPAVRRRGLLEVQRAPQ